MPSQVLTLFQEQQKMSKSQKRAGQESVSFKDVTVDFTWDEWLQLTGMQRTLYRDVMLENYSHLVSVGCCITKPEVIFKLEQGEEPWPREGELPGRRDPDRSQENQDKHLWRVSLIDKNTQTKKRDDVFRKTPCQYDLCGMSLNNVLVSIISDKNPSSKNSNEINTCGKLLLGNNRETTHTGKKSDEHNQDGKSQGHNEDPVEQQKSHFLGPPSEGNDGGAAILSEAAVMTAWRAQAEEKSRDYKEQGANSSDGSTLEVQQESHTGKAHSAVNECEKPTLVEHQKVNVEEKTHECNETENNLRKKSHLIQPHKTQTGEKTFGCSHCKKSFYQESHLIQHQKTHTRKELCESNKCGKTFQKSQPTAPQRTHTGEEPSECREAPQGMQLDDTDTVISTVLCFCYFFHIAFLSSSWYPGRFAITVY
ncbi:Zinc finger protein 33B [Camelus dromedarius]|uniref:Zinc finger protein 33B n=1 Tax=Camelus dromedarius TaxID=9838 RepID=A0A5N4CX37_CAMDR|nr:Zinc finger protein 33B [Camelus dromedarius]